MSVAIEGGPALLKFFSTRMVTATLKKSLSISHSNRLSIEPSKYLHGLDGRKVGGRSRANNAAGVSARHRNRFHIRRTE